MKQHRPSHRTPTTSATMLGLTLLWVTPPIHAFQSSQRVVHQQRLLTVATRKRPLVVVANSERVPESMDPQEPDLVTSKVLLEDEHQQQQEKNVLSSSTSVSESSATPHFRNDTLDQQSLIENTSEQILTMIDVTQETLEETLPDVLSSNLPQAVVPLSQFLEEEIMEDSVAKDSTTNDGREDILSTANRESIDPPTSLNSEEAYDSIDTPRDHEGPLTNSVHSEIPPAIQEMLDTTLDDDDHVTAPSVGEIIRFAIPAVGVWLCSPLLSLIDTSTVGLMSGTIQQAALNPATAVTDYAALLIAFLYTSTTNQVAAARQKDANQSDSPITTKTLMGTIQLSWVVGALFGAVLFGSAGNLVQAMVGKTYFNPAVVEAATRYVRIRALGMPAAAMIGTAQAACLGMKDAKSPLYVLIAAALVNLVGDLLFVPSSHPWIGGAAGAAWATTFSQYAAVLFFIKWLCSKPKTVNITGSIMDFLNKPPSDKQADEASDKVEEDSPQRTVRTTLTAAAQRVSRVGQGLFRRMKEGQPPKARAFLHGRVKRRQFFGLPPRDALESVAPYFLPVTSTQLGRVSGYVAMSHVISSSLGTLSMAAQQVIIALFYSFTPLVDSLSLTAQSFVPPLAGAAANQKRAMALRKTIGNFAKVAVIMGSLICLGCAGIPLFARFSTQDAGVLALVRTVVPYLIGISGLHAFVCAFEGYLLGIKDLSFVGRMYGVWCFLLPAAMLQVKKAALAGSKTAGLTSVWGIFLIYQMVRCASWTGRTLFLQRQTEKDALMSP